MPLSQVSDGSLATRTATLSSSVDGLESAIASYNADFPRPWVMVRRCFSLCCVFNAC
jgi:hypothetical protein